MRFFKVAIEDIDDVEFMDLKQIMNYARNIKEANPDCPRKLSIKRDFIDIVNWVEGPGAVEVISSAEYYIGIARNRFGTAVRDNSKDELISLGMAVERGEYDDED